jgi:recombinational DNA repair protein RecR
MQRTLSGMQSSQIQCHQSAQAIPPKDIHTICPENLQESQFIIVEEEQLDSAIERDFEKYEAEYYAKKLANINQDLRL